MSNAMRKGCLLLILAMICAATLVASPVPSHASGPTNGTSWTDDSPGGGSGTNNGDPDNPDPNRKLGTVSGGPVLYMTPRQSVSTGYSFTNSGVTLRGWVSSFYWAMRLRLGL